MVTIRLPADAPLVVRCHRDRRPCKMCAMTTTTDGRQGTSTAVDGARTLLVNAVVAGVLGTLLMILVHELVHLVAGLAMGIGGTLYSYGVMPDGDPPDMQYGIMAIAAPIFSLVTGLIMSQWLPLRRRGGFGHLLWVYFAFASMMEGVGYLVIAPMGAGDTATAASRFGWPVWTTLVMCAVGIALQFTLAWMFAPHVGRFAGDDKGRRLSLALWAWMIATGITALVTTISILMARMELTDGEATALIAAGTALLVWSPMALIFRKRIDAAPYEPLGLPAVPVAGIVALVVLIVVNQVLNTGVHVG